MCCIHPQYINCTNSYSLSSSILKLLKVGDWKYYEEESKTAFDKFIFIVDI
jgi:hypothetical protein